MDSVTGTRHDVDVAAKFGFITLPVAVYESDDETAAGRQELLNEFADTFENRTKAEEDSLWNSIGEYFGQSWHCEYVDFVAFRRGLDAELIEYQRESVDRWLSGGEGHGFPAVEVRSQRIPVPDRQVGPSSRCAGLDYVPGPGQLREGPNPDSAEDGEPYNEEMFDDD